MSSASLFRGALGNLIAQVVVVVLELGIHGGRCAPGRGGARGGTRAVISGISLPNEPSVALHEKFGFEKVAHFKDVGRKFNQWIDVGYWELVLGRS